ncbi:melanoma-derived growth regulatory protein isoform X1 [Podarcis raffonei]|uniref:melanoma-derived growth regulatory protein isoform X1 n=1 Tax=Podarcis raffonei TaxID=65483 RepID=UPI0023294B66|nr:melanoma-derived growth regulatory protein isoform X1 [Podarcis raffonei]
MPKEKGTDAPMWAWLSGGEERTTLPQTHHVDAMFLWDVRISGGPLCFSPPIADPISIAVALHDYIAPDCRFIHIQRGQVVYVFSKLKGRGRLFWGGSVQGDYYGEQPARLGYFPSSVVQENQYLKPGKVEVKTDKWDFYCQ